MQTGSPLDPRPSDRQSAIGRRLAPGVAAAVFVGAWLSGVREWGLLLGGGFGWLPAAFVAAFAGLITYFAWLPAALIVAAVAAIWLLSRGVS